MFFAMGSMNAHPNFKNMEEKDRWRLGAGLIYFIGAAEEHAGHHGHHEDHHHDHHENHHGDHHGKDHHQEEEVHDHD